MDFIAKAVFCVLVCMTFQEIQAAEDIITSSGGVRYKYVGCYKDKQSPRALPKRLFSVRGNIDWTDLKKVTDMCAEHARKKSGGTYFGIQFYGECWAEAGPGSNSRYDMYKKTENCYKGVGGEWTNAVYQLIDCDVDGYTYKDGGQFFLPQNPIQYNDISCQSCSCDRGETSCSRKIMCDLQNKVCEKFIPAPQGKCCPTCACYHNNTSYTSGQTWVSRQPDNCYECTCVANEAKCGVVACAENCPNPVYEPGKCCPRCNAGIPATQGWFTVTEPPTRPAPVFPPFKGFPGNHKRGLKMKKRSKKSNN